MHDAPNGHTLVDEPCHCIGIIRRREDEDTTRLCFLQRLCRDAAVPGHDKTGNPLVNAGQNCLGLSVAHEHDVVPFDDLLNRCDTSGSDADLSLDCLRLITGDKHLTVGGMNDVAIAYAHIREIRHAELLKIPLGKITDRDDADEKPLAVRYGNRPQIILTQNLPQIAQGIVLTHNDLAVHRNILDAWIEIGDQERLFDMEVLQRKPRLLIHFAGTRGNGIDAHGLLQMGIADRGADRIRVRITMPNDINWLRNVQNSTSYYGPVHRIHRYYYSIFTDSIP